MEIAGRGVNEVFSELAYYLAVAGVEENSRNGPVLVAPEPVLVTYRAPAERVLFSPLRDANPFFHLIESLWMLAGRDDVAFPAYFNSRFTRYSDDGRTLWGAYGRRWRSWFGYDQLLSVVRELQRNPESRRAVLSMWCAGDRDEGGAGRASDLEKAKRGGRDVPCNTHAYFDLRGSVQNLTVCNRSNDLLWGLTGANAVHMSILLEYMAAWVGAPVGEYRQFSNNVHAYPANLPELITPSGVVTNSVGRVWNGVVGCTKGTARERLKALAADADIANEYKRGIGTVPLISTSVEAWDADLREFLAAHETGCVPAFRDPFFAGTVWQMYRAWRTRKEKRGDGLAFAERIAAPDWRLACTEWIRRREEKR